MLAVLLGGCGQEGKQGAAGPGAGSAPPPPEVTVVTVGKTEADLTQDLPGRLEAYRAAQVRARVDGIVEKRLFTEGSDVKAGATLFQIPPAPIARPIPRRAPMRKSPSRHATVTSNCLR